MPCDYAELHLQMEPVTPHLVVEDNTKGNENVACSIECTEVIDENILTSADVTQVTGATCDDSKVLCDLSQSSTQNDAEGLNLVQSLKNLVSKQQSRNTEKLMTMLKIFEMELTGDCGMPFDVFGQYVALCSDSVGKSQFDNDFGVPVNVNIALCLLAGWLGREFAALAPAVGARAERFKLENIDRVHSLPRAEVLVDQLFPECMKILLLNWMSPDVPHDHTYSPPRKLLPSQLFMKKHVFAFIQLILEFANSALVSGVAHVLHTRLLHDNT